MGAFGCLKRGLYQQQRHQDHLLYFTVDPSILNQFSSFLFLERAKLTMPTYSEQDLQEALADIQDGMGLGEASRKYMIPKSTLHGRLHNARPRAEAFERYQALSKV